MSIPPLPPGLANTRVNRVANRLHSLSIRLLRRARTEDRHLGLTPERSSLLSVLVFSGSKTVSELADIEQVSRPAISRSVSSLEALGYVSRVVSEEDRRQVIVSATRQGRALMEEGRRRRVARVARELEGLELRQLKVLEQATGILDTP